MRTRYDIQCTAHAPESGREAFPARIPGNLQADFLAAYPDFCPDLQYADSYKAFIPTEDWTWTYTVNPPRIALSGAERLFFVTEGIDYRWEVLLDGERLLAYEGMFSRVELDLTDRWHDGAQLEIRVLPHPKLPNARTTPSLYRDNAAQSCKPAVAYGWDWHPRLLPSGIWDDTYFEVRAPGAITAAEPRYTLAEDFSSAQFRVDYTLMDSDAPCSLTLTAPDGSTVYDGDAAEITVERPALWWCSGQGEPNLYTWTLTSPTDFRTGTVGFRRIELVMNDGAWKKPGSFPKSRSHPPATFRLNGRNIFAKGSNYVNQEIFTGTITAEAYHRQIKLAKDANMNIFRCWGGAGVQKQVFYDLCDREGIMIWLEFPLACNNYIGTPAYLKVLEQEATAIIKKYRHHACIALWCGGNELFNAWSKMTDQSLALRLLNKLTYELAPEIPFNMTSPLDGMSHGGYIFLDRGTGKDPFALYGASDATAYTEFGVPSVADPDTIRRIIPADEQFPPVPGGAWEEHHGFNAWGADAWLCLDTLKRFGDVNGIEDLYEISTWLECMGYKGIFEAARRQWPACSMAVNWCWNEPWICAAGNSLIAYPDKPKDAYYAVRDSLRPITPVIEVERFAWTPGEDFTASLWLCNDTDEAVAARVSAWADFGDGVRHWFATANIETEPRRHGHGNPAFIRIPATTARRFTVCLVADVNGTTVENRYTFALEAERNEHHG